MPNKLEVVKSDYEFLTARIPQLKNQPEPVYLKEFSQMSKQSRRLAIACLLMDADRRAFQKNLEQAGYFRLELLEQLKERDGFEKYSYTSFPYGFWDAVASGNVALAKQIANLSTRPMCKDFEYPEDYFYVKFVMSLFQHDFKHNEQSTSLLDQFYAATEETETIDYSLCQALYGRNASVFREAIENFLETLDNKLDTWSQGNRDALGLATEGFVSIECLAWLFLAKAFGIKMPKGYRFAPDLGRLL